MNNIKTILSLTLILVFSACLLTACNEKNGTHPEPSAQPVVGETLAGQPGGLIKWHEFNEGLALAKEQNKCVAIDFYTVWCSACRMLEQNTFTSPEIAARMNDNVIAIRVDAEGDTKKLTYEGKEMTERQLATTLQVTGYPTIWFFNSNGERMRYLPGYRPPGELADILDYVSTGAMERGDDYNEFLKTNSARKAE